MLNRMKNPLVEDVIVLTIDMRARGGESGESQSQGMC